MIRAEVAQGIVACLLACACSRAEPRGTPTREDSTIASLPADTATTTGVPSVSAPASVPQAQLPAPRAFPTSVAGFAFGQTIADLRAACANAHNGKSEARLTLNGSYAECPVQPTPLDFTKDVTGFHVTGGKVVVISVTPTSYADGLRRISDKYGQPSGFEVAKKWQAWDEKAAVRMPNVRWQLAGGDVYLMAEAGRVRILFFSELAHALQNEGF